jgi:acetoin utilization deacetylase AcuC-like enzyme
MPEVALVYHDDFLKHLTGYGHPESSERLEAIMDALRGEGLLERLHRITPTAASEETVALVHTPDYIQWVSAKCREGASWLDHGDTVVCRDSYRVALLAVGAATAAADWVMEKEARSAFCAVRPPGHHAEADRAMGFCLFNNVAICARYLQGKHSVERVLILDWDVHHGNGSQSVFYADPSVFYFSVHEYPYYPGTGAEEEKGTGEGTGATLNVPLRAGSSDEEYIHAFREKLVPAADRFEPDVTLISAGFDAHISDPLAAMCMTDDGFAELTRIVREIADKHSKGRIVSVLEGGYDLKAMPASVVRHLRVLSS